MTTSRTAAATDFHVDVEGIGTFVFGKRTLRDEVNIQASYSRLIQGTVPSQWLALVSGWISVLETLTVEGPAGWDLWSLDPLDDDSYEKLGKVHAALTEKERSFRRQRSGANAGNGAGTVENGGVLVPQKVQPAAD